MLRSPGLTIRSAFMAAMLFSPSHLWSQQSEYSARTINSDLKKKAHAVVRKATMQLAISDEKRAAVSVTQVVTILDNEGRTRGTVGISYDKFSSVDELDGRLFDAEGNLIRTMTRDDIMDYSAISNNSLYEDNRYRSAELYHNQYPYTVEFSYVKSLKGYIGWPPWFAQESEDPVEVSTYEVTLPLSSELRYWCNRDSIKPTISSFKNLASYKWTAGNLPQIPREVFKENPEDATIVVRTAPSVFSIEGEQGNMTSWRDFGAWYYKLSTGRDALPDQARRDAHSMVTSDDSPKEKVRKLYNYLQSRTRYVSIQLGIGGWQPFDASYVHNRGYGDCKALANYMVALLKEVSVPAYPVLIRTGDARNRMLTEFPSNQFNHVIVCVPIATDTVWLECTSQSIPFGHISKSNEDRHALLVSPEGGIVVRTPTTASRQNVQRRTARVTLAPSGSAVVSATTTRSGNQQDYVRHALEYATTADRELWILHDLQQPTASLNSYTIEGLESHNREVTLALQFTLPRYATLFGTRIMFQPNLMERRTSVPADDLSRLYPVYFSYRYFDFDSISFLLPAGFAFEALPNTKALDASFGSFRSSTDAVGDSMIVFTRSIDIRESVIPPESYAEYQRFFAEVVRADRDQVVLVRKRP